MARGRDEFHLGLFIAGFCSASLRMYLVAGKGDRPQIGDPGTQERGQTPERASRNNSS